MSIFLKILRSICGEPPCDDSYYETIFRNPSRETHSDDTQEKPRAASVQPKAVIDKLIKNSSIAKPECVKKSLERTNEVSQNSKSSSSLHPTFSYNPPPSSTKLPQSSSKPPTSSCTHSPSSPKPPTFSSKPSLSSPNPATSYHSASPSFPKPPPCTWKSSPSPPEAPSSSPKPLLPKPSTRLPPSTAKDRPSSKTMLSPLPSSLTNQRTKTNYALVQKGTSPIYMIPKDIEDLIKKDIVPKVLKKQLSPSTYKDYFATLLNCEDSYIEKWSKFQLLNVALELHEAAIYNKSVTNKNLEDDDDKDDKIFVAFKVDSVRERRPFLLSRDFVYVRPSGSNVKQFQGTVYRVVKSTTVLVEFKKDFHSQHYSTKRYDVSFSFNRECLKRAHQAIEAASDPLFQNFLFTDCVSRKSLLISRSLLYSNPELDQLQESAVRHILSFRGSPPYLVEGPLCVTKNEEPLSRTGVVVKEAVSKIYRTLQECRILICAPLNRTCDVLFTTLMEDIPESNMFRANASFREIDGVPADILGSCPYKRKCFVCPSIQELRNYNVIISTFVTAFRLHKEGLIAGHFSHIFLVDASSATEPEIMVALANLASNNTSVIVTGANGNQSGWVRSDIARKHGLKISYFERLYDSKPYQNHDPQFITNLI